MKTLVKKAIELDINILNCIEVQEIEKNSLQTQFGTIGFKKALFCTNGFSQRFFPEMDVEPARAQVVVTSEIPELKVKGIYHFDRGYYYFRNVGNRLLFGGGRNLNFEAERTTEMQTTKLIINQLKKILHEQILPSTPFEIEHQWAGTMGVGRTKAPIVKAIDTRIFCGIRLGGMGVAIGSLVGKELAELASKS